MARGGYDTVELRRRIAVCFTGAEIQRLANDLGIPATGARAADEAARDLIREMERRDAVEELVGKLREARPLVEWPEPDPAITPAPAVRFVPASAPPPPPAAVASMSADEETMPASTTVQSSPLDAKKLPAPPLPRAWPGTAESEPKRDSRSLDARVVVAILACMVALAVIAYVAGRASSGGASASPAASASAAAKHDGLALQASEAIARGAGHVARACEVAPGALGDVFRRAYERCGPQPPPERPRRPATVDAPVDEPPSDEPQSDAPLRQKPREPIAPSSACVSSCESSHKSCVARCGPEPTMSTQYSDYQQCLARCLAAASKCRLGCPN